MVFKMVFLSDIKSH